MVENWKPCLVMVIMGGLCPSIFMILLQFLLSNGINGLVLLVYGQAISTLTLSALAFVFEKGKRPPLTFEIVCYALVLALLQVTLVQLILTLTVSYVGATFQSIAMSTTTIVVFVLAVIFKVERFKFWSIHGQAKMWGVAVSASGAMVMVLWTGPALLPSLTTLNFKASQERTIGMIMIAMAVLSGSCWNLLVGHVSRKYPANISLSAIVSFFGTIQVAIISAFVVKRESWLLKWEGGLMLITILYGGIVMTGLSAYAQTWCIHKKGSVFSSAFSPLPIFFSFLLETFVLNKHPHLGSIVGGVLVVVGIYMLLWGKANDNEKEAKPCKGSINEPLI